MTNPKLTSLITALSIITGFIFLMSLVITNLVQREITGFLEREFAVKPEVIYSELLRVHGHIEDLQKDIKDIHLELHQ